MWVTIRLLGVGYSVRVHVVKKGKLEMIVTGRKSRAAFLKLIENIAVNTTFDDAENARGNIQVLLRRPKLILMIEKMSHGKAKIHAEDAVSSAFFSSSDCCVIESHTS